MKPEAVVFDIGNVLLEWNPERFYDASIGPDRRRALFAEVDLAGMNEGVDLGAPFAASVQALAAANPKWAAEVMLWQDHWIDMASPPIPATIALLRALRAKGVPVFALTNFGRETFAFAQTRYDFLNEFDQAWVSGILRLVKPDPAIYAVLEAECGVAPERLFFTDDRAENIAAAGRRGWQTHHFTSAPGLAQALVSAGLLTESEARP
ncbi:HAD family hydrolase [Rhodobacter ferrooxidans]|uniref:HAD-superfamily hydrolase, subfamily IA, variant 3 n=1 Tax=Rhodobacter ferrooxidans TaxID=371731 RepID=C8RWJ6_9RHOB|nr:HAD family phosphatase [Rhodobacter sp. SW2]EEW26939.1 HAD-superfamily hydrolase, subfamily IA, variant 3 [Rhodobacter sp. SW2]